jgi:uncharacterized protein (DUF1501 family)
MPITRRDLLKDSLAIAALGLVAPSFLVKSAYSLKGDRPTRGGGGMSDGGSTAVSASKDNILVVIQLSGGNDGLGTVIPYSDPTFFSSRPTLAPDNAGILKLTDSIGLHPNLPGLKSLFDNGHMAIMQGVGYPNPNRSHFRSMQIWQSARPDVNEPTGWLGRFLEADDDDDENTLRAINIGNLVPRTLWTETTLVPSITNLESYQFRTDGRYLGDPAAQLDTIHHLCEHATHGPFEEYVSQAAQDAFLSSDLLKDAVARYQSDVKYGDNPFAEGMRLIAQVINADLGTRIFYISLGGFDTHANQAAVHANLLKLLDEGVAAFYKDLERMGKADKVAVMTFSEFGRRVKENGSRGTDHGAGSCMFVAGPAVAGGPIGNHPKLDDLDSGDLKHAVDFRRVYATILDEWLGCNSQIVLAGKFDHLPLFKKAKAS